MKDKIKFILRQLLSVKEVYRQNREFKKNSRYPVGHYYSTIVSVDDVKKRENEIWKNKNIDGIKGIELRTDKQLSLLKELSVYYSEMPFKAQKEGKLRYQFENIMYSYTDGIVLYSMMRHFKPNRIIEVGSGYSSALMLDTNELFFNNQIHLTFIEPYPERLYSLINDNDKKNTTILEHDIQSVDLEGFKKLEEGDILFIDSSHVVKCGSDVNYIVFEIFPILNSGVLIHIHDIFYPFEYPKGWVLDGRNWNEDYFIKTFLMYNNQFDILLFSEYLHTHYKEAFENMPLTYKNGGGNLWLKKK